MASTPDAARRDALDRRGAFKGWAYLLVKGTCFLPIRVLFRLRVVGLERVPETGGAIVAPTHRSNFDSVVVGVALHRHLRFMAKAELYRSRPFAWLLRSAGAFKVERGKSDMAAVEQAIELARGGELVCIFPEGTRNRDGTGKPFSGAARMKITAGVPMIPVAVMGTDRVRLWPPRLPQFTCAFGAPLQDDDLGELEERWQARRLTERWSAAIEELRAGS
jgi:1-acyl-sn-glycerol-3-phosphate acyltransferase